MSKKVYKVFFDAVEGQERWLNEMAAKGYRLTGATRLGYEFDRCEASEYQYKVEYVADKSYQELKKYQEFLQEMGYRTFHKNIKLNYSLGKAQWRPYAKGAGMLATSPGSINKELLILEKQSDGKPFELHTDTADLLGYYRSIRNAYLYATLMLIVLIILGSPSQIALKPMLVPVKLLASCIGVFTGYLTLRYAAFIHTIKQKRRIIE